MSVAVQMHLNRKVRVLLAIRVRVLLAIRVSLRLGFSEASDGGWQEDWDEDAMSYDDDPTGRIRGQGGRGGSGKW